VTWADTVGVMARIMAEALEDPDELIQRARGSQERIVGISRKVHASARQGGDPRP